MKDVHVSFRNEAESVLTSIASKYNIGLQGVGVAAEGETITVIAKFKGGVTKPKPRGKLAYFPNIEA